VSSSTTINTTPWLSV